MKKYDKSFRIKKNVLTEYIGTSSTLEVPDGVKKISSIFDSKVNIDTLILSKSMKTIEKGALYKNNIEIKSLIIYDSLEYVGENNFFSVEYLEIKNLYGNVIPLINHLRISSLKKNLKTIKITERKISAREEKIIESIFPNITLINVDYKELNQDKRIEGLQYEHNGLTEVEISSTVEEIGYKAYANNGIRKLYLPSSVKVISEKAFINNAINFLTLYDSIEKISSHTFGSALKEINIINNGNTINVLKKIKRTHILCDLERIIIIGTPLNLFESLTIKEIFGKQIIIKWRSLESLEQPTEIKEETVTVKDLEVQELLNKIRTITEIWNEKEKQEIEQKINSIIQNYKNLLEKSKNYLSSNEILVLEPLEPSMIRENFIIKLECLYRDLYSSIYIDLLKKIKEFEIAINNNEFKKVPTNINSLEDKISFITYYSNLYETNYIGILHKVFSHIKREITNLQLSNLHEIPLLTLEDTNTKLENEINTLYKEVKRRKEIEETLNGKNETSLGVDIKTLLEIINDFGEKDKSTYQKSLSNIIQKYYNLLLKDNNMSIELIELDLRKELLPFIASMLTIKPKPSLNKIKEKIKSCKNLINNQFNKEISENLLTKSIKEFLQLLENENLNIKEKEEIKNKLEEIFDKWQNKIETEENECLNYLKEPDILMISAKTYKNEIQHLLEAKNVESETKELLKTILLKNIEVPKLVTLENQNMQIELIILKEILELTKLLEDKIRRNKECARLQKTL